MRFNATIHRKINFSNGKGIEWVFEIDNIIYVWSAHFDYDFTTLYEKQISDKYIGQSVGVIEKAISLNEFDISGSVDKFRSLLLLK